MSKDHFAILKFLALHLACGIIAAAIFGSAILVSDLSHIYTLAMSSAHPTMVIVLLYAGLAVTFGGVAMMVGVMTLGSFSGPDQQILDEDDLEQERLRERDQHIPR